MSGSGEDEDYSTSSPKIWGYFQGVIIGLAICSMCALFVSFLHILMCPRRYLWGSVASLLYVKSPLSVKSVRSVTLNRQCVIPLVHVDL